jgi:hypothetical protein
MVCPRLALPRSVDEIILLLYFNERVWHFRMISELLGSDFGMCLLQALKCHAACASTEQSKSSGSKYICRII